MTKGSRFGFVDLSNSFEALIRDALWKLRWESFFLFSKRVKSGRQIPKFFGVFVFANYVFSIQFCKLCICKSTEACIVCWLYLQFCISNSELQIVNLQIHLKRAHCVLCSAASIQSSSSCPFPFGSSWHNGACTKSHCPLCARKSRRGGGGEGGWGGGRDGGGEGGRDGGGGLLHWRRSANTKHM